MDSIKDIVSAVIKPLAQRQDVSTMDLQEAWSRITNNPRGSAVEDLKDGCLTVHVDSSARLVQLNFKKRVYLEELSQKFPQIKRIQLKVGKI